MIIDTAPGIYVEKIYRGAYNYFQNEKLYCEETFEIFRDTKDLSMNFKAQIFSRVATGELLKIEIEAWYSKSWTPISVDIVKYLGDNKVSEEYKFDLLKNKLIYTFSADYEDTCIEIQTPPRFHISTPSTALSLVFLLSKKFDINAKNNYSVLMSNNDWHFRKAPAFTDICLEKDLQAPESIKIGDNEVQGTFYKLYDHVPSSHESTDDYTIEKYMNIFMSKHLTLPYFIETHDSKVVVKYLNCLDDSA